MHAQHACNSYRHFRSVHSPFLWPAAAPAAVTVVTLESTSMLTLAYINVSTLPPAFGQWIQNLVIVIA